MSSPSGASSGSGSSSMLQKSGSEEDLQHTTIDQRKRKRMLSNRESARRSRMRKQKHFDDLMVQVSQLRKENNEILKTMDATAALYLNIEADNSILRAQMAELTQRLQSLNEIVDYINSTNTPFENQDYQTTTLDDSFTNPWSSLYLNHPLMASADMFMY